MSHWDHLCHLHQFALALHIGLITTASGICALSTNINSNTSGSGPRLDGQESDVKLQCGLSASLTILGQDKKLDGIVAARQPQGSKGRRLTTQRSGHQAPTSVHATYTVNQLSLTARHCARASMVCSVHSTSWYSAHRTLDIHMLISVLSKKNPPAWFMSQH